MKARGAAASLAYVAALVAVAAGACHSSKSDDDGDDSSNTYLPDGAPVTPPAAPPPFDAAALPRLPDGGAYHAIVERDLADTRSFYALSDIHGGYDRFAALAFGAGITASIPAAPQAMKWAAGDALFVVVGDLVDKGSEGLEVIDALRALEIDAAAAGGEVLVLLGNHEAEFFADPHNSKATGSDGLDVELAARGIDPASFAMGIDPRGAWLRLRPLGVRVNTWFFSHAGNTKGRSLADLDLALGAAIATHPDYDDPELVGIDSILEARNWYGFPAAAFANAESLRVSHIVFGHDPSALGAKGDIQSADSHLLFRIDCGMTPDVDDSKGCVLRVRHDAGSEIAEEIVPSGIATELWRSAP